MQFKRRFFLVLTYLFFGLCLMPVVIFTYKHPAYNFDMLGYMALVVRMDQTHDLDQVHMTTYEQAKKTIPPAEYEKLTETPAFRKKFETDPSQFEKILPIYSVKPLYVACCWLFYKDGFTLVRATVMPSLIAYIFIGLLLFHWLRKYMSLPVAFLSALLFMCSMFVVAIAGHSTPDCLSAFFLFSSAYFILQKPNVRVMFIFFLLSVFTRADNVIICFFVTSFLAFNRKWRRIGLRQYFLMAAILAIAYLGAILPVTQFGWSVLYYSQYARHIDFSRDFDQAVGMSSYFSLVFSKLVTALVSTQFTLFMFLCILILRNPFRSWRAFTFDQTFLVLLLVIVFFRFLFLPDLSDRFYFGFYLIFIILLVRRFFGQISPLHQAKEQTEV